MKKLLTVILIFCAYAMCAQVTQVSGNQSGIWSGEIHLIDDVVVPSGESLTIKAGTEVVSDGYFGIMVFGDFYANGEVDARITFTVADTTGYSNLEVTEAGAWKGLTFSKCGNVRLSYCDFSYGKTDIDGDGGVMRAYYANEFEVDHCAFHHNTARKRGGAFYAENSVLNIHHTAVYDNICAGYVGSYTWGAGFQLHKCNIDIRDMVFHDNNGDTAYGGGMCVDSSNMELKNSVFYNNYAVDAGGFGIQRSRDYTVKVANVLAYNNSVMHYGGGFAIYATDPEMNNLTIVNNLCGGGGGAGMQLYDASPVLKDCIFWGNHAIYVTEKDTVEYYMGSQIWLWGDGCYPTFYNGVVQYGLDTINAYPPITDDRYFDMIKEDPLFVDEENHDYQLVENSPCVNTGIADISGMFLPGHDLAGNPRVCGGRIDRGCYELCYADVSEVATDEKKMFVYPNPLNDNSLCVINLDKKCEIIVRLISLDGKEVYRENVGFLEAGENRIPLDGMMKNIEKGNKLYLLNIDNQYIKVIY